MKTVYDMLIQCGYCNRDVGHYLTFEKPEIGQETVCGICHRCEPGAYNAVILEVQEDQVYREQEELIERYEDIRHHVNDEQVADLFVYDDETGKYVPKHRLELISMTVWTIPIGDRPSVFIDK